MLFPRMYPGDLCICLHSKLKMLWKTIKKIHKWINWDLDYSELTKRPKAKLLKIPAILPKGIEVSIDPTDSIFENYVSPKNKQILQFLQGASLKYVWKNNEETLHNHRRIWCPAERIKKRIFKDWQQTIKYVKVWGFFIQIFVVSSLFCVFQWRFFGIILWNTEKNTQLKINKKW